MARTLREVAKSYDHPGFKEFALTGGTTQPATFLLEIERELDKMMRLKEHTLFQELVDLRDYITEDVFWGSQC